MSKASQQRTAHMIPPAGPAWAGSLMGTSITSSLCHVHGFTQLARVFLVFACGIVLWISIGWLRHRNPSFRPALMPPWGMYTMGLLALGAAGSAVSGNMLVQFVIWCIATPLAVVVCTQQLREFPGGAPSFQWGLALVAPMVAATSSGQLANIYPWMTPIGIACFILTWATAVPIFVRCYISALRGTLELPPSLAGTAWVPVGMVGQSTAAAQVLFPDAFAHAYGAIMLSLGVLLGFWAEYQFGRAVLPWVGYTPAWWGSTFPVGTYCLGSHLLALSTDAAWLDVVSELMLGLLLAHWCICAARWATWFFETKFVNHRPGAAAT